MGFFGGSKTYVSSVVYNLAGDIDKRPDYMKTSVVGAILSGQASIPDTLQSSYLKGPGIRLKSFARWARTGSYNTDIGLQSGNFASTNNIDQTVLAGEILSGCTVNEAVISPADFTYWADQYVGANRPADIGTAYISSISSAGDITITFIDTTVVTFTPIGYDPAGSFLYAEYTPSGATTPLVFIYEFGTGNSTLDAMWPSNSVLGSGSFFPHIPFRINNQEVKTAYPSLYTEAQQALKKAIGADYDAVDKAILTNPSINDIDYAYAMFGCCLNTKDNSSRRYIFNFFDMVLSGLGSNASYATWLSNWNDAQTEWQTWWDWYTGPHTSTHGFPEEHDPSQPPVPVFPGPYSNSFFVDTATSSPMNFNISVSWDYLFEETGSGSYQVGATGGMVFIESGSIIGNAIPVWTTVPGESDQVGTTPDFTYVDSVRITLQVDDYNWRTITLGNAVHQNLIYKGNAVLIKSADALADPHESGFIIPLHEDVVSSLSLKDTTQMSTACCYLMFNCYEVVKQRWYQTGFFQFLLIVVVIIISIYTFGVASVGAAAGLLGTNAAVGAALGLAAGTFLAVLVGAVANALAAMILITLIDKAAVLIFGDKFGEIIGAIVAMVALPFATGLMNGQSLASVFKDMMSVLNILKLTEAVGNGLASYIQASAQTIEQQMATFQNQVDKDEQDVQNKSLEEFGYGAGGIINPLQFTDGGAPTQVTMEAPSLFLTRTLMTGTDIAGLSTSMISNFTDLTLSLDLL